VAKMRIISTSEWPNGPTGALERKHYAVRSDPPEWDFPECGCVDFNGMHGVFEVERIDLRPFALRRHRQFDPHVQSRVHILRPQTTVVHADRPIGDRQPKPHPTG
jgi:hypothetical protein